MMAARRDPSASARDGFARLRRWLPGALLLLAFASSAVVHAQFQEPTSDELKMTADPKAPGAAAVYLKVEETANDLLHYESFYARIKILTEKGKELATVDLPYLKGDTKITDIKARTIHPDGTVIPLIGKPADLLISKATSKTGDQEQIDRKVFTLPSVEVGSIVEYSYELRYDDHFYSTPTWEIQRPYFVHKAHYTFTPASPPMYRQILPPGVQVEEDHHFNVCTVNLTDIPPVPNEEWMPPIQSLLYKVIFYYMIDLEGYGTYTYWVPAAKDWSKGVDRFAESTRPIREAVNGLIVPSDSDLDKAKKLYKAVQALDNTDFSRKRSDSELKQLKLKAAKHAEDTWIQKSGSSEDIALLYLAMLRAAGLTAYAMKVVDRERSMFDLGYLSLDQLDDTLVILSTGGNEITLDPGEKMSQFGMIHWKHSGAGGIRQGADGRDTATAPLQSFADNTLHRDGDIALDEHGVITGNLRFTMAGQEALRWRQAALRNDQEEVKKQFDLWLEETVPAGIDAHIDYFQGLDNPDVDLIAIIKVQGALAAATSKRLLLPGFFFETRGTHPFIAQEKRLTPVDMHYAAHVTDQIVYHLPPGLAMEGAPQDAKISWPKHAILVDKTVTEPGQITIRRSLATAFTFAKPEEYQDLRGFYQKVAAADQQQLVLTTAPVAAKGN
jgi:hypothetical protein